MIIWIDAQLPPALAPWIKENFKADTKALREIGLHTAPDRQVFEAARKQKAIVMTKDYDFVILQDELGTPPQVIWITCGNTSNDYLKEVLQDTLLEALNMLKQGEALVEIRS